MTPNDSEVVPAHRCADTLRASGPSPLLICTGLRGVVIFLTVEISALAIQLRNSRLRLVARRGRQRRQDCLAYRIMQQMSGMPWPTRDRHGETKSCGKGRFEAHWQENSLYVQPRFAPKVCRRDTLPSWDAKMYGISFHDPTKQQFRSMLLY